MNNSYVQFSKLVSEGVQSGTVAVPKCISDDFCTMTPVPRNDGILAMAFVDIQPINGVYPENVAFCNGTLFPNLNMPFLGGKCK